MWQLASLGWCCSFLGAFHLLLRSKGPSLHRRYPASAVLRLFPSPRPAIVLSDSVGGATSAFLGFPQLPRPPSRYAVVTTPVDRTGAFVGCFPVDEAFPVSQAGRHPRHHFRGLLKLHSCYGLPVCSPTLRGLCHEASIRLVTQSNRSLATKSYRQLLGWDRPPLVICAVGAH